MKTEAINLKSNGELIEAINAFKEHTKKIKNVRKDIQSTPFYNHYYDASPNDHMFDSLINNTCNIIKKDTVKIEEEIKNCYDKYREKNIEIFTNIEDAYDELIQVRDQGKNLLKNEGALDIYGEVVDIQGHVVQIFGTAKPPSKIKRQYIWDYEEFLYDPENINGVLMKNGNIIIEEYNPELKKHGSTVIGEKVSLSLYCYSTRSTGINQFGSTVNVWHYKPCNCISKLLRLHEKMKELEKYIDDLFKKINITQEEYKNYY